MISPKFSPRKKTPAFSHLMAYCVGVRAGMDSVDWRKTCGKW